MVGRLIALFLGVVAVCVGGGVQAQSEVTSYRLDNGMQVLLVPDARVPKVAFLLEYSVGGTSEPVGRSGFAHLFEHLMFAGTEAVPDIDATYGALGITYNATTRADTTLYWASGLASTLPVLLSVEADRMANLGRNVGQEEFDVERNVVLNEMRQRYQDQPGSIGSELLRIGLFPKDHPYSRPVIGSMADLEAAELDDVVDFFNRYYVPGNAVLSISGDFDVAAVKELIAETFGLVPAGTAATQPAVVPVAPQRLQLVVSDRVSAPRVLVGFAGPPEGSDEGVALGVAARLLSNYEYGVLRQALVETGVAGFADASYSSDQLGGRFLIFAAASPGVTGDTLKGEVLSALADFAASELTAEDVERELANMRLEERRYLESQMGKAGMALWFDQVFGTVEGALEGDPRLERIDADDVMAAIDRILRVDEASTAVIEPSDSVDFPDVLRDSSGTPVPMEVAARPPVMVPILPAGEPGTGMLPARETGVLSNRIKLVHYLLPDAPMVFVAASAAGGVTGDPPEKAGLLLLAARMSYRGAAGLDFDDYSKAAKDIGADVSARADVERTSILLEVPPDAFAAGAGLLADAVQRPAFSDAEWAVLVNETRSSLAAAKQDISNVAGRTLRKLLFGTSGFPLDTDETTLNAITLDDAKAAFAKLFTPKTMTIYTTGALTLAEMTPVLEAEFGAWTSESDGLKEIPHPPAVFAPGRKVYILPDPGASQSVVIVARPAPGFDDPGFEAALAVSDVLAADNNSRLNNLIRKERGYSYGVSGNLSSSIRHGNALIVSAPVQADKAGAALADILAGFGELKTEPMTADELQRTATSFASSIAGRAETGEAVFYALLSAAEGGITLETLMELLGDVVRLPLSEAAEQGAALSELDTSLILLTGDPEILKTQLAAIGITDAEVLPREDASTP